VSPRKAPVRRCSWRNCSQPAAATVAFRLPNLLAGSERDYCSQHTALVCAAKGTRVLRRLGVRQPVQRSLPGLDGDTSLEKGARPRPY
jgi:hypothetical protein